MSKYKNVLEYIANNKLVEKLSRQYVYDNVLKEDFIAEIYLILAEKVEKLEEFRYLECNKLRNFIITIIRNQWISNSSDFYNKYKRVKYEKFDFHKCDLMETNNGVKIIKQYDDAD